MDEDKNNESFVRIVTLNNEVEAALLDSMLSDEKIPHLMQTYHDTALDGIYQLQKGWGVVAAPEHYRPQILEMVEDLRSQPPPIDAPATDAP